MISIPAFSIDPMWLPVFAWVRELRLVQRARAAPGTASSETVERADEAVSWSRSFAVCASSSGCWRVRWQAAAEMSPLTQCHSSPAARRWLQADEARPPAANALVRSRWRRRRRRSGTVLAWRTAGTVSRTRTHAGARSTRNVTMRLAAPSGWSRNRNLHVECNTELFLYKNLATNLNFSRF